MTYLYILEDRICSRTMVVGRADIPDKLEQQLRQADIFYASQSSQTECRNRVDDFIRNSIRHRLETGMLSLSTDEVGRIIAKLLYSFMMYETPSKKLIVKRKTGEQIKHGTSFGSLLLEAGNPGQISFLIDVACE